VIACSLARLCAQLGALLALPGAADAAQETPPPRGGDLALAGELERSEDVTASGLAFVELGAARDTYLAGEAFRLRLRFGFERESLPGLVQLFPRPLDLPAQVLAPGLEHLDGAHFLGAEEQEEGASFVLGERIARATRAADEERAGRVYAVFEYERALAATRPGELVLAAPLLGFAHATSFREDFVLGAVPLDRRHLSVHGRATSITILPLPEEGRPPEFTGAIGRFTLRASAEPRELVEGQSLKLTVVVEGEGDLSRSEPPHPDGLAGFHLQGTLVERGPERLTAIHDLVARSTTVRAIPPLRFAFFETTPPAGYRTLATEPIPIVVRPPAASEAQPSTTDTGPSGRGHFLVRWLPWAILLAALALAWRARRRRA
jgi:hypothetical protein